MYDYLSVIHVFLLFFSSLNFFSCIFSIEIDCSLPKRLEINMKLKILVLTINIALMKIMEFILP